MNIISVKQRTKGVSKEEQEKLDILASDFRKLDESRKDYIRELTRILADIHCSGEFRGTAFQKDRIAFQNTHCGKGVFV